MVTIKDVAREADVSVGTVSNVINGSKVSEGRKKRVEEAIEKLGYRVNTLAKGMRSQDTNYVVVLLPSITNPFFAILLRDLEREISSRGKQVILCISDQTPEKEKQYIEMAKQNHVCGIIGVTYSDIEEYVNEEIPFISIERYFHSNIPHFSSDNYGGGRLAAEELVKGGSKNLLFIQIISSVNNEVKNRRRGFEDYCSEHEIPYSCIEFSEKQVESIYSAFSSAGLVDTVLNSVVSPGTLPKQIDGIFAGTDHLAYVVCDRLQNMGLSVPKDIQVIGYDGIQVMNSGRYIVSSILQDTETLAKICMDALEKKIRGINVESVTNIPVKFVYGGTTRILPAKE